MSPKTIDLVSLTKDQTTVELTIVETEKWDDKGERTLKLQDKIKSYLEYIESGQLYKEYPETKQMNICITIRTTYKINEITNKFIEVVKKQWLSTLSIELIVKPLGG